MNNKEKYKKLFFICVIIILALVTSIILLSKKEETKPVYEIVEDSDFTTMLIKKSFQEGNYLISPYSIKIALNMLKDGANKETKKEIEKVLSDTTVNKVNNVKIANAIFIKDIYKDIIEQQYINGLKYNYSSDVLFDEFYSPEIINTWASEKTDAMIQRVIERISSDFVLGLINATTIDAKWKLPFECNQTISEIFTTESENKLNVEMMHNYYKDTVKYLYEKDIKGVIVPYENNLEFIALLPEDMNKFMSLLTKKKLDNTISSFKTATNEERVKLSLPRFKYEYNVENFIDLLTSIGIKKAFNPLEASFSNIITKENLDLYGLNNIYVDTAVHKTFIDLNEERTRAAAITFFGFDKASAVLEKDYNEIEIKFNKPFIYMIRDSITNEILFFGKVNEPNIYKGSTCTN